ncbi:MAG: helix-hairpin-helix domain-containing protein [Sphingobacterium sp.]|jgi:DNA uptake protein ComE-like DNA-binding protein|uniref:helix-hairpin-helix domain-containing protein n=1 Tax=Sphingobacterium sp. TaxID=341027 RepID=UPI00283F9CF4|nr:helix-hairpin-helix domain-containing protein [Sphingobacterium sp.]MDR3007017.1 helix-hairpin-helix domain-containing protein [Sphingobacterium sp.]
MKRLLAYFKFNKTEQNGFFIILVIIVVFITIYSLVKRNTKDPIPNQAKAFEQSFHDSLEVSGSANNQELSVSYSPKNESKPPVSQAPVLEETKLFYFDPNNLPHADWHKLGLSDKQITVLKNYESKGGRFRKKSDLKKIYSINDRLYKRLEPYIQIKTSPDSAITKQQNRTSLLYDKFESNKAELIDINTCDTTALKSLKGIGSILSKRILKYKDVLGGFYRIEQLKEVYGVTAETYDLIKDYIVVSSLDGIKKININKVDAISLAKHPYLSPKDAKMIVNYRDQHGSYVNIEDLTKIGTLSDLAIAKIAPYLIFENDSR